MSELVVSSESFEVPSESHEEFLEPVPVEESAFRSYIRRCSCCICVHSGGKNIKGEKIGPERSADVFLYQVSDVAHVKTRGAGGEDIENIVPLCRLHHNELHQHGILTFEIRYNFDIRNQAVVSYQEYLDTLKESDHLEFAQQAHQRILVRVDDLHNMAYLTGKYLSEFREMRAGNKMLFTWLGFGSFNEYISTPLDNGGLGLSSKTAYRWINFYQMHLLIPQETAAKVGISKADPTVMLLREAKTEEDRQEIVDNAVSLNTRDFNEYANKEMGRPDRATVTYGALHELLLTLLDAHGVAPEDVNDDIVERLSSRIIATILSGGKSVKEE